MTRKGKIDDSFFSILEIYNYQYHLQSRSRKVVAKLDLSDQEVPVININWPSCSEHLLACARALWHNLIFPTKP
jgi:hypothetical protein